jgi:hypothetical protein
MIPREGFVDEAEPLLREFEGQEAVDEVRAASWSSSIANMEAGITAGNPHVGIFWLIGNRLLTDTTPLLQAGSYGSFLIHAMGHFEISEQRQRFGPKALERHRLPPEIAWTKYENHPRGHVVSCWSAPAFVVYADRTLLASDATMAGILDAFGLDPTQCLLRSDEHYRTVP